MEPMIVSIVRLKKAWSEDGLGWCIMCQAEKPLNGGEGWGSGAMDNDDYRGDNFCPECMKIIEHGSQDELLAHITPTFQELYDTFDDHEDDHALNLLGWLKDGEAKLVIR